MNLNVFKKLVMMTILALPINPILAKEVTLVYEPDDKESSYCTFDFFDGQPLTHKLMGIWIKACFNFTEEDLDHTTLAVIYADKRSPDIFVDLELTGEITEFTKLMTQRGELIITVIKDPAADMSDEDAASYGSDHSPAAARSDEDISHPNLIKIIYDTPIESEQCQYIYDPNKYGNLSYARLHQILREECNVPNETLDHCYAGLRIGEEVVPITDLKKSRSLMKEIPGLRAGSIIHVFNWEI